MENEDKNKAPAADTDHQTGGRGQSHLVTSGLYPVDTPDLQVIVTVCLRHRVSVLSLFEQIPR